MVKPGTAFFRDPAAGPILDPAAAKGVAIVWATYSAGTVPNSLTVRVSGVAKGGTSIKVSAAMGSVSQSVDAAVDAGSGLFSESIVDVLVGADRASIVITARLAANVVDRVAFPFDVESILAIPAGSRAVVGPASTSFAAGIPDRLVRLRYFQRIYAAANMKDRYDLVIVVDSKGRASAVEMRDVEAKTRGTVKALATSARAGDLDFETYRRRLVQVLAQSANRSATSISLVAGVPSKGRRSSKGKVRRLLPSLIQGVKSSELLKRDPGDRGRLAMFDGNKGVSVVVGPVSGRVDVPDWTDFFDDLMFKRSILPVGILFSDRLRFQPAGSVVGEQVYALSLAPNEEVQVRQSVETKRRTVQEDVKDREQEQELTLSSTWSTDLSETVRESKSQQSTTSLGGNASADLESLIGLPVNLGGNVAFTGTQAQDAAREVSTRESFQTTTTAAARMRSAHKVRVEITNETGSAFSSTRTLRNPNQLRGMTCLFHKVYRKERVTLERYQAQLCLRLEVADPCAATRPGFLEGLSRLDPDNPDLYSGVVPGELRGTVELTGADLKGTPNIVSDDDEYDHSYKLHTDELNLVSVSKQENNVSIQSDYVLVEKPQIVVEQFKWGGDTYTGMASLEEIVGKSPGVYWEHNPKLWKGTPKGTLFVWHRSNRFKRADGTYKSKTTAGFRILVKSRWAPSSADMSAYTLDRLNQRQQLVADFNPKDVEALRDVAIANFHGAVLAQAVAENLDSGPALKDVLHLFDIEGAFIETLPFWASEDGRSRYSMLRSAVERMPKIVVARDILVDALTASSAVVYLPIREGFETEALVVVSRLTAEQRRFLQQQIAALRAGRLDSVDRSWDDMDVITGPASVAVTPNGAPDWATEWEQPSRRFEVLAQWSEYVPTDGVHVETMLSASSAADEATADRLSRRER